MSDNLFVETNVLIYELEGCGGAPSGEAMVAAAQRAHCVLLLTEDLQEGREFGGVRIANPFESEPRPG